MSWQNRLAKELNLKYAIGVDQLERIIKNISTTYIAGVASGQCPKYASSSYTANTTLLYIKNKTGLLLSTTKLVMDGIEKEAYGGYIPQEVIEGKKVTALQSILNPVNEISKTATAPINRILIPIAIIGMIGIFVYMKTITRK
jgi:hypothetical protein